MSTTYGFTILAEKTNETIEEIVSLVSITNYIVKKEGIYPIDFYMKPDVFKMYGLIINYFKLNGKNKLKIFIEVSASGSRFMYHEKCYEYDIELYYKILDIVNKGNNKEKIWIFPFWVNSGIRKTKPSFIIESWSGKFI